MHFLLPQYLKNCFAKLLVMKKLLSYSLIPMQSTVAQL